MENKAEFVFTFIGERAQKVAERFSGGFWDGGLDQTIEQDILEEFGLSCDDMKYDSFSHCIINTDEHPEASEK